MNPYFDRPERIEVLRRAATSWIGTPFAPNSSAKGFGVSCQRLAAEIYREAGLVFPDPPDVPMAHARFTTHSLVVSWMGAKMPHWWLSTDPQVGDLLGFRIGGCVHHLGVLVAPGVFVQALERVGVIESLLADATWEGRLSAIWRPME